MFNPTILEISGNIKGICLLGKPKCSNKKYKYALKPPDKTKYLKLKFNFGPTGEILFGNDKKYLKKTVKSLA